MLVSQDTITLKQIVVGSSAANEVLYVVPAGKTFVGSILTSSGTFYGYNLIPAGASVAGSNFIGQVISSQITLASGTMIRTAPSNYNASTTIIGVES
jgi:hypothetical protein